MFLNEFNNTSKDLSNLFPITFYVYYPSASIDPLNYSYPYSNGIVINSLKLSFNKSYYYEISSQVIEMNTDSSYILNSKETHNVFTFDFRQFLEELFENDNLLDLNFVINPIKIVYQ